MLTRSVDARFEVLGGPNSLLSVSLSASQNLYTRRGTLVGVGGKVENVSTKDLERGNPLALINAGCLKSFFAETPASGASWSTFSLPEVIFC